MQTLTREALIALLRQEERVSHREHQPEGVYQLITDTDPDRGRVIPKVFALCDEVGAAKTKQCIDAAQILYNRGEIDTVLVITIDQARSTWAEEDPALGEVAKHAWDNVPNIIHEYHKHYSELDFQLAGLHWVVSNFSFIRRDNRLWDLIKQLRGRRTWMIVDESWSIKGFSAQMRACRKLRAKRADRATILNGTPLADGSPEDMFYQLGFLDPDILGCSSKADFRAKYCIEIPDTNPDAPKGATKVTGYKNLEDYNRRIAPYILARKTRDCFDLPPMLPPLIITATLTPARWKQYVAMRDDLVVWMGNQVSVSKQAVVKILRLAQITSGYLGGFEEMAPEFAPPVPKEQEAMPAYLQAMYPFAAASSAGHGLVQQFSGSGPTKEIGREKLDAFLFWLTTRPKLPHKLLVWCRFRAELERVTRELGAHYLHVLNLKGDQPKDERRAAKAMLAPGGDPRQGAVVGTQKAGGASLNFAACSIAVYFSNAPALLERTQSLGRIERPGAFEPMQVIDIVAVGPRGQKTIDHQILKCLREKDDMARYTVQRWRDILKAA